MLSGDASLRDSARAWPYCLWLTPGPSANTLPGPLNMDTRTVVPALRRVLERAH